MEDDLATIAENRFEQLENEADTGDNTPETPADNSDETIEDQGGEENINDNSPEGGENETDESEDGQTSEENESSKDETEDVSQEENESDEDGESESEQTQEIDDERFLAELERRGLKVAEREDSKLERPESRAPLQKPEPRKPREIPEDVWGEMQSWQKDIYNQLPYIEARGKDGNVIRVKTDQQLPDDFEFADDKAKAQYNRDITSQAYRAEKLNDQVQAQMQQQQQQELSQKQAQYIVNGVENLQKQGVIPKITAKPNTPEYNKDPGVTRANQILDIMYDAHQKGEYISVETAGRIFKAEHPELYKPKTSAADKVRKQKSRNISGGGRGTSQSVKKAEDSTRRRFPMGTSASDIADYYSESLD